MEKDFNLFSPSFFNYTIIVRQHCSNCKLHKTEKPISTTRKNTYYLLPKLIYTETEKKL